MISLSYDNFFSVHSLRSLSKHERLVDLHGSVIDHTYAGGSSIAVLLIMERLHRDLYTGLKVNQCRSCGIVYRETLCSVHSVKSLIRLSLSLLSVLCLCQAGLSLRERLQIALDVVEGIRFLHSQGLLHRDIKLKNVLVRGDQPAVQLPTVVVFCLCGLPPRNTSCNNCA